MSSLVVVGGLYQERCTFPGEWDRVFGSGGRAAVAVASHVPVVTFQTYGHPEMVDRFRQEVERDTVTIQAVQVDQAISFSYLHSLSTPWISPLPGKVKVHPAIPVNAQCVLRFGMLEGAAHVVAERCVYDPQSSFGPAPYSQNGSQADHLAIVGNLWEVTELGRSSDPDEAARHLIQDGAEVVVLKLGASGARVVTESTTNHVPPYRIEGDADEIWTLGSGDVFSAVFAARWCVHGEDPVTSADLASKAVAYYASTKALPVPSLEWLRKPIARAAAHMKCVYLAGPFFTIAQRWLVEEVRRALIGMGHSVFSPLHDVGVGDAYTVAPKDIGALHGVDAVFAILDGLDSGTLFEVGYARALEKPVFALAQAVSHQDLKMVEGTGCHVYFDLVTAVHQLSWTP